MKAEGSRDKNCERYRVRHKIPREAKDSAKIQFIFCFFYQRPVLGLCYSKTYHAGLISNQKFVVKYTQKRCMRLAPDRF